MSSPCTLCRRPLDEPALTDPRSGDAAHMACVLERFPHDATVALLGALALFVIPFVRIWSA
jgi:hypothetical protein